MTTSTADITLDSDGRVVVRINEGARQTLAHAEENLAAAIKVGGGEKRPLLTDIRVCEPLTPEARRYYSGKALVDSFTAIAILIANNTFGSMMGNVYLRIAKPGVPSRLFTDEEEAKRWLSNQ